MTDLFHSETNNTAEDTTINPELVSADDLSALAPVETELQVTDSIDYNFVSRPVSPTKPASPLQPLLTPWSLAGILCLIAANTLLSWHQFMVSTTAAITKDSLAQSATELGPLADTSALSLDRLSELALPTVPAAPSATVAVEVPTPPAAPSENLASLILPPSLQPQAPGLLPSVLPPVNGPAPTAPPPRSLPAIAVRPVYTPSQGVAAPLPPPPPPSVPANTAPAVVALPPAPVDTTNTSVVTSVPQSLPQEIMPPAPQSFNQKTRQTLLKNYNRDQGSNAGTTGNETQQLIQELQNLNQAQ